MPHPELDRQIALALDCFAPRQLRVRTIGRVGVGPRRRADRRCLASERKRAEGIIGRRQAAVPIGPEQGDR